MLTARDWFVDNLARVTPTLTADVAGVGRKTTDSHNRLSVGRSR